jgi:hypothetical protein
MTRRSYTVGEQARWVFDILVGAHDVCASDHADGASHVDQLPAT